MTDADEATLRSIVEVELLSIGVPFDALNKASEDQMSRWYGAMTFLRERDHQNA